MKRCIFCRMLLHINCRSGASNLHGCIDGLTDGWTEKIFSYTLCTQTLGFCPSLPYRLEMGLICLIHPPHSPRPFDRWGWESGGRRRSWRPPCSPWPPPGTACIVYVLSLVKEALCENSGEDRLPAHLCCAAGQTLQGAWNQHDNWQHGDWATKDTAAFPGAQTCLLRHVSTIPISIGQDPRVWDIVRRYHQVWDWDLQGTLKSKNFVFVIFWPSNLASKTSMLIVSIYLKFSGSCENFYWIFLIVCNFKAFWFYSEWNCYVMLC